MTITHSTHFCGNDLAVPEPVAGARWIWSNDDPDQTNVWVWFRRRFTAQALDRVRLYISADLRYMAWVNGHMIGFGPPKMEMRRPTLDSYSITEHLTPGENVLSVLVYSLGNVDDISSVMPRRGAMLAAIEVDGRVIPSDKRWKACRERAYLDCAIRRHDMQPHNEVFDARYSLGEPWRSDYDDAA